MRDTHVEFERLILECHRDRAASILRERLTKFHSHALSADIFAAAYTRRIVGGELDR